MVMQRRMYLLFVWWYWGVLGHRNIFQILVSYFKNMKKPVYSYSMNPDRRFSSSTSQHFKMFPPFASSEGYSASGVRYQSDSV